MKLITVILFICLFSFSASAEPLTLNTLDLDIQKLASCESRWNINALYLDTDGFYSYGLLQFHLQTFINFGKQYGILPDNLSKAEAKILIYNPWIQVSIARKMLDEGLWKAWYNCARIVGINA